MIPPHGIPSRHVSRLPFYCEKGSWKRLRLRNRGETRVELGLLYVNQYEKRFVELYEQVTAKLEETRRYYDVFNTLQETKKLLQKEISLLNSIESQFDTAMSNYDGKSKFVFSVKVRALACLHAHHPSFSYQARRAVFNVLLLRARRCWVTHCVSARRVHSVTARAMMYLEPAQSGASQGVGSLRVAVFQSVTPPARSPRFVMTRFVSLAGVRLAPAALRPTTA